MIDTPKKVEISRGLISRKCRIKTLNYIIGFPKLKVDNVRTLKKSEITHTLRSIKKQEYQSQVDNTEKTCKIRDIGQGMIILTTENVKGVNSFKYKFIK